MHARLWLQVAEPDSINPELLAMLFRVSLVLCLLAQSWAATQRIGCNTSDDCESPTACCSTRKICVPCVQLFGCETDADCDNPVESCCSPRKICISCGPLWDSPLFGSSEDGTFFRDGPGNITAIRVRSGCVIDGIQLRIGSEWHALRGGATGTESEVTLSAGEYISKISGRTGVDDDCGAGQVLVHLEIYVKNAVTGKTRLGGSFGRSLSGTSFELQPGEISSLWGYYGSYVKGIGVTLNKRGAVYE